MLLGVLLVMRLVGGVESAVKGTGTGAEAYLDIQVWYVKEGGVSFKRHFAWIWHSAVITGLVALLTPFIVPFREVKDAATITGTGLGDNAFAESRQNTSRFASSASGKFRKRVLKVRAQMLLVQRRIPQRGECLADAANEAFGEVLPVIISITSFASLAKLMGRFEMTQALALVLVDMLSGAPGLYAFFIPIIATLGSGLTGSSTTSNFLFGRLQVNTAKSLNLIEPSGCLYGGLHGAVACTHNSIYKVGAAQMFGATAGEIISPMNAVVITLMDGVGHATSPPPPRLLSIQKGTRVHTSLWDSRIFGRVPGTRPNISELPFCIAAGRRKPT